jgi:hypothetical protein
MAENVICPICKSEAEAINVGLFDVSGFVAKLMANSRSRITHWQCTKTQKLRDGRPLLGAQRTGRRLLRRLGHGLPATILDEGR